MLDIGIQVHDGRYLVQESLPILCTQTINNIVGQVLNVTGLSVIVHKKIAMDVGQYSQDVANGRKKAMNLHFYPLDKDHECYKVPWIH